VACPSSTCGDYEISDRAIRELSGRPTVRTSLQQLVASTNANRMILEIFVSDDGQLQTNATKSD
jgi:hypothetical protein